MSQEILFTLEWARVSMFQVLAGSTTRAKPWGTPDPQKPIILGSDAEGLTLIEQFEEVERRPTGAPYPERRHLSKIHKVTMDRVWVIKREEGANLDAEDDYLIVPNRLMVLVVIWWDGPPASEITATWKARTYYGVTASEFSLRSTVDSVAFTTEQPLSAMFYKKHSGSGPPPQLP
jgi:hypothetical protein